MPVLAAARGAGAFRGFREPLSCRKTRHQMLRYHVDGSRRRKLETHCCQLIGRYLFYEKRKRRRRESQLALMVFLDNSGEWSDAVTKYHIIS
jgi:hypothetical protein